MCRLLYLMCFTGIFCRVFYVDKYIIESNPAIVNATVAYTHDKDGAAVINLTAQTFKTITKAMVYVRGCLPENKDDRQFRRETLRTVIDVEKIIKGVQQNPFLKNFMKEVLKTLDFEVKMPMPRVSLPQQFLQAEFIIFIFRELTDSLILPLMQNLYHFFKTVKCCWKSRWLEKSLAAQRQFSYAGWQLLVDFEFEKPAIFFCFFKIWKYKLIEDCEILKYSARQ